LKKLQNWGGMYGKAMSKMFFWLNKAVSVAENDRQREVIQSLIKLLRIG
jgi:dipeptidyl-peptidase-3